MYTRIVMQYSSEGLGVKEVVNRLSELGFTVALGKFDYEYKWSDNTTTEEVLDLLDKVIEKLRGCNVMFHLTTGQ
jgi:hypothetical protein